MLLARGSRCGQQRIAARRTLAIDTLVNVGAFIKVARLGSFSAAARDLRVAPSVVTKRISQLEKQLGMRLVSRSTRGLTLTSDGERYLPRLARLMAEHDDIFNGNIACDHKIEGRIHIATPPTVTSMFIGTMLSQFQLKHPRVDMELVLMERSVNPLEEGFDLALSAMPISYPNVMDVPLCRYDLVTVCAPCYLRGKDRPQHPTDLVDHQCLTTALFRTSWGFTHARGSMNIEVHSHLQSSDSQMVRDAARMGMGIAILPRFLVKEDLRTGVLIPVLEDFPVAVYWLNVQVPRMKMNRPTVRGLVAFLKEAMHPVPPWER
jgi:DNA-binding transcriptional LysR family regulator